MTCTLHKTIKKLIHDDEINDYGFEILRKFNTVRIYSIFKSYFLPYPQSDYNKITEIFREYNIEPDITN